MSAPRCQPYGDRAVLIDGIDDPARLAAQLARAGQMPALIDIVPAAESVLVVFDPSLVTIGMIEQAAAAAAEPVSTDPGLEEIVLEVRYDGPDLPAVADELGWSVERVVATHSQAPYAVRFCGFSPGFGYLTGLPREMQLARLDEPRTRVPAGSVGVAGEYTGVYPNESPGGWRILGRTKARLFDVERRPPALLVPGRPVRFRPT
ncbi:allophanate hydrolase subunit 1 [Jatrophihabitans telluris]|uniref:Allophanate hydrolase subunit 1 n=1 Tax=Jatrophihabitans telluris TaxID=2038343 RepID=A0ABY4R377_9ACTN|nr:allophanate hydrolase subunit 1 [Jatrophihabitans telluris]UQX89611.1 allophanate hydrolase subunit 1 [Jatrophihabitans telluris]